MHSEHASSLHFGHIDVVLAIPFVPQSLQCLITLSEQVAQISNCPYPRI